MQKGRFSSSELVTQVVEMLGDQAPDIVDPIARKSAAKSKPIEDFGSDDRPSVLIVDDNIWDARLMRRLLEAKKRFEVIEVHSARQAMTEIDSRVPALILLDLIMPGTNGEKLLEMLRANAETEDVPVIVISAKELSDKARTELTELVDSIWSKAVMDRNSLLEHIDAMFQES